MKHSVRAVLLAAICASVSVTAAHAQKVETAKRETLLQATSSWNGKPYTHYPTTQPQLTVLRVTLQPHTALPWHTHPFPNTCYILEGDLTIHDRASGATHTYHKGEVFGEADNAEHRGEAGDKETVLLLTYAGTPGVPPSIPAKGEKPEY
ncbi:cupin domain-containing protein [Acetobacter sp. AN02]|uniref:cupin domain-containing protein n=1 Tax=Acetobacter sp. AN02 TaxID=2894186 RepID=UPI00243439CF|nr:cupin domain-containing protein [Acetobacter sp. AN02]MDG6095609.1 cupin domain-containing protein [Acetobacter sp. AN02]